MNDHVKGPEDSDAGCDLCGAALALEHPPASYTFTLQWELGTRGRQFPIFVCSPCDEALVKQSKSGSAMLLLIREAGSPCLGCGGDYCAELWPQQRKCCPDCTHDDGGLELIPIVIGNGAP